MLREGSSSLLLHGVLKHSMHQHRMPVQRAALLRIAKTVFAASQEEEEVYMYIRK